uniref:uncharacterized protein n=1 Tax=Myxine glutinosa TaxID=7769 RepID=UPI0035901A09
MEDEGTYGCRFEFAKRSYRWGHWYRGGFEQRSEKRTKVQIDGSHIHETYNCTMEGTKKLCVQREVMGVRGEDVILPCRFNHSKGNNITNLNLVLSKYFSSGHNVVIFNNFNNDTDGGFNGRIQTVGSLSEGDGSVRIRYLKIEDEGTYRCRFEFDEWRSSLSSWHHGALEARKGKETTVRVDVYPKILHVWREFVNSSTSWKLFCEAEAKPRPNITWWNPQGHLVNGSEEQPHTTGWIQTRKTILEVELCSTIDLCSIPCGTLLHTCSIPAALCYICAAELRSTLLPYPFVITLLHLCSTLVPQPRCCTLYTYGPQVLWPYTSAVQHLAAASPCIFGPLVLSGINVTQSDHMRLALLGKEIQINTFVVHCCATTPRCHM